MSARPGYFTIDLESGIRGEITASNHTALYKFTFFGNATGNATVDAPLSPLFIVDLTDLPDTRQSGSAAVDPETGRMTGTGNFGPSFGLGRYDAYFCADFKGGSIRDTGVFINNRAGNDPKNITVGTDNNDPPLPAGTWVWFEPDEDGPIEVTARVGVSFISIDQACSNAEKEAPDLDFETALSAAESAWKDKLSVINIDATGVDDSFQSIFWSGIYRAMLSPQDYTGENPLWQSNEPYYDSYYCIWDSFRSIHPFITLVSFLSFVVRNNLPKLPCEQLLTPIFTGRSLLTDTNEYVPGNPVPSFYSLSIGRWLSLGSYSLASGVFTQGPIRIFSNSSSMLRS